MLPLVFLVLLGLVLAIGLAVARLRLDVDDLRYQTSAHARVMAIVRGHLEVMPHSGGS